MRNKVCLTLFLISCLFQSKPAGARETFYLPSFCKPSEAKLRISNASAQAMHFGVRSLAVNEGLQFALQPGGVQEIALETVPNIGDGPLTAMSVLASDSGSKIQYTCGDWILDVQQQISPLQKFRAKAPFEIRLLNLHGTSQNVSIYSESILGKRVLLAQHQFETRYDEKLLTFDSVPMGSNSISVEAEGRISAYLTTYRKSSYASIFWPRAKDLHRNVMPMESAAILPINGALTYFLMGNPERDEYYVLPLEDLQLIAQARELIQTGYKKLVSAEIRVASAKSSRANRNFVGKSTPWSWEVERVYGFNDFGSIDCDGSPQQVEDLLLAWHKPICFWSYHLIRELSPTEVSTGQLETQP